MRSMMSKHNKIFIESFNFIASTFSSLRSEQASKRASEQEVEWKNKSLQILRSMWNDTRRKQATGAMKMEFSKHICYSTLVFRSFSTYIVYMNIQKTYLYSSAEGMTTKKGENSFSFSGNAREGFQARNEMMKIYQNKIYWQNRIKILSQLKIYCLLKMEFIFGTSQKFFFCRYLNSIYISIYLFCVCGKEIYLYVTRIFI